MLAPRKKIACANITKYVVGANSIPIRPISAMLSRGDELPESICNGNKMKAEPYRGADRLCHHCYEKKLCEDYSIATCHPSQQC
jgi:hypothetical protein